MSLTDAFVTLMEADTGAGGAATLLTGGIYTYAETGRLGINQQTTPSAWDATTRKLKPCAVVKDRARVPDGGVTDDLEQLASWRQVVEIYLYQDGDTDGSTLDTVADRLFVLFHGRRISSKITHWANSIVSEREPALNRAHMNRIDFAVHGIQGV